MRKNLIRYFFTICINIGKDNRIELFCAIFPSFFYIVSALYNAIYCTVSRSMIRYIIAVYITTFLDSFMA